MAIDPTLLAKLDSIGVALLGTANDGASFTYVSNSSPFNDPQHPPAFLDNVGRWLSATTALVSALDSAIQGYGAFKNVAAELPGPLAAVNLVGNLSKLAISLSNAGALLNKVNAGTATPADLTAGILDLVSNVSGVVGSIPGLGVPGLVASALSVITGAGVTYLNDPDHPEHAEQFNHAVAMVKSVLTMTPPPPPIGLDPNSYLGQQWIVPSSDSSQPGYSIQKVTGSSYINQTINGQNFEGMVLTFADNTHAWVPLDKNQPVQWSAPYAGSHQGADDNNNPVLIEDSTYASTAQSGDRTYDHVTTPDGQTYSLSIKVVDGKEVSTYTSLTSGDSLTIGDGSTGMPGASSSVSFTPAGATSPAFQYQQTSTGVQASGAEGQVLYSSNVTSSIGSDGALLSTQFDPGTNLPVESVTIRPNGDIESTDYDASGQPIQTTLRHQDSATGVITITVTAPGGAMLSQQVTQTNGDFVSTSFTDGAASGISSRQTDGNGTVTYAEQLADSTYLRTTEIQTGGTTITKDYDGGFLSQTTVSGNDPLTGLYTVTELNKYDEPVTKTIFTQDGGTAKTTYPVDYDPNQSVTTVRDSEGEVQSITTQSKAVDKTGNTIANAYAIVTTDASGKTVQSTGALVIDPVTGGYSISTVTAATAGQPEGVPSVQYFQANGQRIVVSQQDAINLSTGASALMSVYGLVNAIQTHQVIGELQNGLSLVNLAVPTDPKSTAGLFMGDAGAALGLAASINSFDNALKHGDTADQIVAGAGLVDAAGELYAQAVLHESLQTAAESSAEQLGGQEVADVIGDALPVVPYLQAIDEALKGNYKQAAIDAASIYIGAVIGAEYGSVGGPIGAAVGAFIGFVLTGLFAKDPDPYGTATVSWTSDVGGVTTTTLINHDGGGQYAAAALNSAVGGLSSVVAAYNSAGSSVQLGLIANRLDSMSYGYIGGVMGLHVNDASAKGTDPYPSLTFDPSTGLAANASASDAVYFQTFGQFYAIDAFKHGAIAPMWEVQTAQMQSGTNAGLNELDRATNAGHLAAPLPVNATTEDFNPIALNLGGGFRTTSLAQSTVQFNVNGTANLDDELVGATPTQYLNRTEWLNASDGYLVLDKNLNGTIDNGEELFSNSLVNEKSRGLASLAVVDANGDNVLNSLDPVFNQLRVWRDANQDGIVEAGETVTLASLGVTELDFQAGTFVRNGVQAQMKTLTLEASTTGTAYAPVPGGIQITTTNGQQSILVNQVADLSSVAPGEDRITAKGGVPTTVFAHGSSSVGGLLDNDHVANAPNALLNITGVSNASHGTVSFDSVTQAVTFTPDAGYVGDGAGFDYTVDAGAYGTGGAHVVVNVLPNDAPPHITGSTFSQIPVYGFLPENDSTESDQTNWVGVPMTSPGWGYTEILNSPTVAVADFEGVGYAYRDQPIAYELDPYAGDLAVTDVNGTSGLTWTVVQQARNGTANVDQNGHWTFSNAQAVGGDDAFVIQVKDANGKTDQIQISVALPSPPPVDNQRPIIFDLNGTGFHFESLANSTAYLNSELDGQRHQMGWFGGGNGVLAVDVFHDGIIHDSSQISFTKYSGSAFTDLQGLAGFDSNHDGVIDKNDARWGDLGLWVDANGDGVSQAGEFRSLDAMGIASISLTSDNQFSVSNGVVVNGHSTFTRADGSVGQTADATLPVSSKIMTTDANGNPVVTTASTPSQTAAMPVTIGDADSAIVGTAGDNMIRAGNGNDTVVTNDGNDVIALGNGNNTVKTGDGRDMVTVGDGNNTIFLGAGPKLVITGDGNNIIVGGSGNSQLYGGAGRDEIYAGSGNSVIEGGAGDDTLVGGIGHNALIGDVGNDLLMDGGGVADMYGGAGDDTYSVTNASDKVVENANEGIDVVKSTLDWTLGDNVEDLILEGHGALHGTGNALDNVLIGNGGADTLSGGAGNDTLADSGGAALLIGGTGDDTYVVANSETQIVEQAGEGTDLVKSSVSFTLGSNLENLTLTGIAAVNGTGNELDNVLIGNDANNTLLGGDGNDTLIGGGGNDTLEGGSGRNVLQGGSGFDRYVLSGSFDEVDLGSGTADVRGGDGDALVKGAGHTATIVLGNGVDDIELGADQGTIRLQLGSGTDTVAVGNGNDVVVTSDRAGTVDTIKAANGNNTLSLGQGDDQVTVGDGANTITAGNGSSTFVLGRGSNYVTLGDGSNTLSGADGIGSADAVTAGNGNNHVVLGQGNDQVVMGQGNNTVTAGNGSDSVMLGSGNNIVSLGDGADKVAAGDVAGSVSSYHLGNGSDTVKLGDGQDSVTFGDGNDTLVAGSGNDVIVAGSGSVAITLGDGNDQVTAADAAGSADVVKTGNGNSRIALGTGNDQVTVGNGSNTISAGNGADSLTLGRGSNRVMLGDGNDALTATDATGSVDVIVTGNGNSTITLTQGNDQVTVGGGNNAITAGNGADALVLGAGSNRVTLGNGADSVLAHDAAGSASIYTLGDGADAVTLGDGANALTVGNGNDIIVAGNGNDAVTAGSGTDVLTLGDGNDTITTADGAGGADVVTTGNGSSTLALGQGNDHVTVGNGSNTIVAGDGADTLSLGVGSNQVTLGNGTDSIQAHDAAGATSAYVLGNGNDQVTLGDGNDSVKLGSGTDTVKVGDGNDVVTTADAAGTVDVIQTGNGNSTIALGQGNDQVSVGNGSNTITAGNGMDTLMLGTGGNQVNLGNGVDTITAKDAAGTTGIYHVGNGNDSVTLGDGNDALTLGSGQDTVQIGNGNDTLTTADAAGTADIVKTGNGNSTIALGQGNDKLTVGNGSNTITAGNGADTLVLGTGGNRVTLGNGTDIVTAQDAAGTTSNYQLGNGADRVTMGDGADTLTLGSGQDTIQAGNGNDVVTTADAAGTVDVVKTGNGNSTLTLGQGNDQVSVGNGNNTITAGDGADTLVLGAGGNRVILGNGVDTVTAGDAAGTTGSYRLGNGADSVTLGDGNDALTLGSGQDTVHVGNGNDTLTTADAAGIVDVVSTGNGNSTIALGQGNDGLTVGNGSNTITAGNGVDTVVLGTGGNRLTLGDGADSVSAHDAAGTASTYQLGNGADTVSLGDGADNVTLGNGKDVVHAGNGNDTITAGNGADTVVVGNGTNGIFLGNGNDSVTTGSGTNAIHLGIGQDVITNNGGVDTLYLSPSVSADSLRFSRSGNDLLISEGLSGGSVRVVNGYTSAAAGLTGVVAGNGNYSVLLDDHSYNFAAGDGHDYVWGGNGNDTIALGNGCDAVQLGCGNDTINVGNGDDQIVAGSGTDAVTTGNGNSSILLGWGNDTIVVGSGSNYIQAGDGSDTVRASDSSSSWNTVVLGNGNDTVAMGNGNDTVIAGCGNDTVTLGSGSNLVELGSGRDQVTAHDVAGSQDIIEFANGNDLITVGQGNDLIEGGSGNDTVVGGDGNDTVVLGSGLDTVRLGNGSDQVQTSDWWGGSVSVTVGNGNDCISVGNGNDSILAGNGDDTVTVGGGKSQIVLGDGRDQVVTYGGTDTITVGTGHTDIWNYGGNDSLVLASGKHDQLWFQQDGHDLDINVMGTSEQIKVHGWFSGQGDPVTQLTTSDGQVISAYGIDRLVQAMASLPAPTSSQTTYSAKEQQGLNTLMSTVWHSKQ